MISNIKLLKGGNVVLPNSYICAEQKRTLKNAEYIIMMYYTISITVIIILIVIMPYSIIMYSLSCYKISVLITCLKKTSYL